MSFKGHEIHYLEVRYPKLWQDVDIDGGHAELVLALPPALLPDGVGVTRHVTEHLRDQPRVSPLDIEVRVQGDGEILVRHLQDSQS